MPGGIYPSFGNIAQQKRHSTHIAFPPADRRPDDVKLLVLVSQALCDQNLGEVLIGWASNFLLPEDTYIVAATCMSWAFCPEIRTMLTEFIVVSARNMIVKPKPTITSKRIEQT